METPKEFLEGYDPQIKEIGYDNYSYTPQQVIDRLEAYRKELAKESDSLPCVMPSLEDARKAKEKFQERKNISGWDTGYKGVGDHFQDGVNWALNWISKRNKSN